METVVEAVIDSGGYAALCVLLVFQLRENNAALRELSSAIAALRSVLVGAGPDKGGGA